MCGCVVCGCVVGVGGGFLAERYNHNLSRSTACIANHWMSSPVWRLVGVSSPSMGRQVLSSFACGVSLIVQRFAVVLRRTHRRPRLVGLSRSRVKRVARVRMRSSHSLPSCPQAYSPDAGVRARPSMRCVVIITNRCGVCGHMSKYIRQMPMCCWLFVEHGVCKLASWLTGPGLGRRCPSSSMCFFCKWPQRRPICMPR